MNPADVIGLAALARIVFEGGDLAAVWDPLMARAVADDSDAGARMDLATLLLLTGQRDAGLALQAEAVALNPCFRRPARAPADLTVLALVTLGDTMANTPLDFLIEDASIDLVSLYLVPGEPAPAAPAHDVAFLAIGESDANKPALEAAERVLADWPAPALNRAADRIRALTRDGVARALDAAPGVLAPVAARLDRAALAAVAGGACPPAGFPLLVRPLNSHAGAGLAKIDAPADLTGYLAEQAASRFYVTPFVDYAGDDGLYRKDRIVVIGGRPFVCHHAVSEHWMVHYLNAGMTESVAKRDEEAAFMAGFDDGFAQRHAGAFAALTQAIGLDYFGIDCAETKDGRLLVFEADTAMIVHAMDPLDPFAYKQAPMRRLFDAFQALLREAA